MIRSSEHAEIYNTLQFASTFPLAEMLHPSTYLNKILVASRSGGLQLWNVNSLRCVHDFQCLPSGNNDPITCIVQSPVVDVVAIGSLSGNISILNIKTDTLLFSFFQRESVTAISFLANSTASAQSGDSQGSHAFMATASAGGDIAIWDLERRALFHTISGAHDAAVVSAHFLPGSPILLTSGADNSLKVSC